MIDKHPNDPPPREQHALVKTLRAFVRVDEKFVHDTLWGSPDVVRFISNPANMHYSANLRDKKAEGVDDVVGSGIMASIWTPLIDSAPGGPKHAAYADHLGVTKWLCARLAGRDQVEIPPDRATGEPVCCPGEHGSWLRLAVLEFFPTSVLRLSLPITGQSRPLDLWLGHADVREHKSACPDRCKKFRHTMVYTLLLPRGLTFDTARPLGIRHGPMKVPSAETEIPSEVDTQTGISIGETQYANLVVTDAAWANE